VAHKRLIEQLEALKRSNRKDIIIATPRGFMNDPSGDEEPDMPEAGWRSYTVRNEDHGVVFEEVRQEGDVS